MNSDLLQIERTKRAKIGWRCSEFWFCVLCGDSGRSDRQFSTEQEVKLLYAARVTRGHRFGGVSTTPRGRDLFILRLIFR